MALNGIAVLQEYFSASPHGRKIDIAEFRALSAAERAELAGLAAAELGYKPNGDGTYGS